ncbi:MAG: hypothetical protein H0V82_00190 [Candidatus Protochlamydia sp.]|nr:hypothetical protein [Candidatus Protochlamydia sp.]
MNIMNVVNNLVDNSILIKKEGFSSFKVNNIKIILIDHEIQDLTGTFQMDAKNCHVIFLSPIHVKDFKLECITMLALANIEAREIEVTASGEICLLGADISSQSPLKLESRYVTLLSEKKEDYIVADSFLTAIEEADKFSLLNNLIHVTENMHPDFVIGKGMHETLDVMRILKFWNFLK